MGVALVAGGNRGIGLGITRQLLADGLAVSILATREEPTELLTSFGRSATRGTRAAASPSPSTIPGVWPTPATLGAAWTCW